MEQDLGERYGFVDFTIDNDDVVMRAHYPFRIWPLGGWAVFEGWHRDADGKWVPFTEDELAILW